MAINKTVAETYVVDFRDRTGRRFRKTFPTHKEAVEYEKAMLAQVSGGEFIPPSKDTVKDIAEKWHKRKTDAGSYRFATLQNWRTHIDKYIAPSIGDLPIQQVGIEAVETVAAQWARMTSANTANKTLTTLSAIFKLAQRYGPLKNKPNVAQLAERLKISNDEDRDEEVRPEETYSEEELQKLIMATPEGSLERALIMVPALTGIRIGEVLAITWPAVDLKANTLHIKQGLIDTGKVNGGRGFGNPKSKRGRRTVKLPKELAHTLKLWKLKCPPSDLNLVFPSPIGKPLHRKGATEILDGAIEAAGIKRLTFHKLRHTFASLLLTRGAAIPKVSKRLGHRDPVITLKTYTHFIDDKKNDEQELATSILGEKL